MSPKSKAFGGKRGELGEKGGEEKPRAIKNRRERSTGGALG